MSEIKLTYFNGRGRAEVIRLVLAVAGKKFEDVRLDFGKWAEEKKNAPQGTLPYVTIGGKTKAGQSIAIARYFARENGLYGKTNLEGLYIDEIVDIASELLNSKAPQSKEKDEKRKAEMEKEFNENTAPRLLKSLDDAISSRGSSGFAVGSSVTLADLQIFAILGVVQLPDDVVAKYSKLKANLDKTASLPKVKEWVAKRPVTNF
ncbi:S-crystallin SL11-like isoform X1 [Ruditapes philippinarum]|uniref:S-crystallin SL11-like isoform X1 n=1 Tax=Ruditapes philippinarum TaxID=129788 RepID=UPI00295A89A2|nr:S-crystallin SL11-like isoform X1 [Ruditapes philippinarum]